ncbi:MAG: flagellar basal body-associated FliL family protein [Gammaproteobacteria bacterium]|nr:flagellar basal body-associated FliL family protein [Gammaproteobacteria bacterium]
MKRLPLVLCLALSLASGAALASGGGGNEAAKFHKSEEDVSLRFVPMEPNLIANFQRKDGKKLGVLQAQIQLTSKTNAGVDAIFANMPLLRDKMLSLLSAMTEEQVADLKAREALRKSAAAELRKLIVEVGGPEDALEGILFTGFMFQ